MAEEIKEATVAETPPQSPASVPKTKTKPEKIEIVLIGASSCTIEDITLKKGESVSLESLKAERFLSTGLFQRK